MSYAQDTATMNTAINKIRNMVCITFSLNSTRAKRVDSMGLPKY
jgi:hypothetical protein